MSYLSELNNLVAQRRSGNTADGDGPTPFQPEAIYAGLLNRLLRKCVWVGYDMYGEITGVHVEHPERSDPSDPVARVDLKHTPILTARSMPMFNLVWRLCAQHGRGSLERQQVAADLKIRQSKVVLSANLRPYDGPMIAAFGLPAVDDTRRQHRCVIFPLEELAREAGTKVEKLVPNREGLSWQAHFKRKG